MNVAIISGNISRDIETRTSQSGMLVANFNVAVNRRPDKDGNKEADFISCVAFGKNAEFVDKYFSKGKRIEVRGSIQTRTYDAQDGSKRHVTEILVDEVGFGERANNGNTAQTQNAAPANTKRDNASAYAPSNANNNVTSNVQYSQPMELGDDLPF